MVMPRPARPLTPSQLILIGHLREHRSYPEIARRMGITVRTVRHYVRHIALLLPGDAAPFRRVFEYAVVTKYLPAEPDPCHMGHVPPAITKRAG